MAKNAGYFAPCLVEYARRHKAIEAALAYVAQWDAQAQALGWTRAALDVQVSESQTQEDDVLAGALMYERADRAATEHLASTSYSRARTRQSYWVLKTYEKAGVTEYWIAKVDFYVKARTNCAAAPPPRPPPHRTTS